MTHKVGSTPLHTAAFEGYEQVASLLLDWGANPNAVNSVSASHDIAVTCCWGYHGGKTDCPSDYCMIALDLFVSESGSHNETLGCEYCHDYCSRRNDYCGGSDGDSDDFADIYMHVHASQSIIIAFLLLLLPLLNDVSMTMTVWRYTAA